MFQRCQGSSALTGLGVVILVMTTVSATADIDCGWSPFTKWNATPAEFRVYAACKDADANSVDDPLAKSVRRNEAEASRRKAKEIEEAAARAKKPGVSIGMTAEQVIKQTNWGRPEHVNRTSTAAGTREQWVYPGNQYLYFLDGSLVSIQTQRAQ